MSLTISAERPIAAPLGASAGRPQTQTAVASPREAPTTFDPMSDARQDATSLFRKQFADLARDPEKFAALMSRVYGPDHDTSLAESLRKRALAGDFSWLPTIRFVSDRDMHGAEAGYDNASRTVFINQDLVNNPAKMAEVFVEEAGHHLDNLLSKTDSKGDEGELFRRLIGGENISAAQEADIRAFDDKGTVTVDGRTIQVENFFGAFKKAFKSVGNFFKKAVGSVLDVFKPMLNILSKITPFLSIASWAIPGLGPVVAGVMKFVGPITSLLKGDIAGAVAGIVPGGMGAITGKLKGIIGGPVARLAEIGAPYLKKFQDLTAAITNPINAAKQFVGNLPTLAADKIKELTGLGAQLEGLFAKLSGGITGPLNEVTGAINQVHDQVTQLPTLAQEQLKDAISDAVKGVPVPPPPGQGDPIVRARIEELWNDLIGAVKSRLAA